MLGDFTVVRRLPVADIEVEVGPLSLGQSMLARHRAASTDRPPGFDADQWMALHAMALKIRRVGQRPGVTADELVDLADADTATIQEAIAEVTQRENRFRRAPEEPAVGDGPGGEGHGVESAAAGGAAGG